jgi:hypothetical protein
MSTVAVLQLHTLYSTAPAVSQGSPYSSRRAQGKLRCNGLGALFLQARSRPCSGPVATPQFSVVSASLESTEHIERSSGKSLPDGVSEPGALGRWLRNTPRERLCLLQGTRWLPQS